MTRVLLRGAGWLPGLLDRLLSGVAIEPSDDGLLVDDMDEARLDRMVFYVSAVTGQGGHGARADGLVMALDLPAEDLEEDLILAAADELLALFGQADPRAVHARRPAILVRAASRLRASAERPLSAVRHTARPDDMVQSGWRQPYARFFAVEDHELSWRKFDGQMSAPTGRAAFISGDAVTVLPYDPARDRVLVVEQFRAGPFARGDANPWSIEAIAGRIDAGETPESAARREAVEEAGLALGNFLAVASYYPSPGALSEYLYSFVALTDLPDGSAGVFGLADEAEDIRGHLLAFETFISLVTSGEINNGPLILTGLWLQRERTRLRGL